MSRALIGELSIVASTGETLTAASDVALAWLWAEAEVNANTELPAWADMSRGDQWRHVSDALAELRRAARVAQVFADSDYPEF
jgi:hypothetical protein